MASYLSDDDTRRGYYSMFDLMEDYRATYPDATDDECYEAICFNVIPSRLAAQIDQMKGNRRERLIDNA